MDWMQGTPTNYVTKNKSQLITSYPHACSPKSSGIASTKHSGDNATTSAHSPALVATPACSLAGFRDTSFGVIYMSPIIV